MCGLEEQPSRGTGVVRVVGGVIKEVDDQRGKG